MLCLTRRLNEKVIIPTPLGKIDIQILEIDRNKVRLGIVAPAAISIYREEILIEMGASETVNTVWGTLPIGTEAV